MIRKISLADVERSRKKRSAEYIADVLAIGVVDGEYLLIEEEKLFALRVKHNVDQSLTELASSATTTLEEWVARGFPIASAEQYEQRRSICAQCEHGSTLLGLHRCSICGCFAIKLRLASATCPLSKW